MNSLALDNVFYSGNPRTISKANGLFLAKRTATDKKSAKIPLHVMGQNNNKKLLQKDQDCPIPTPGIAYEAAKPYQHL